MKNIKIFGLVLIMLAGFQLHLIQASGETIKNSEESSDDSSEESSSEEESIDYLVLSPGVAEAFDFLRDETLPALFNNKIHKGMSFKKQQEIDYAALPPYNKFIEQKIKKGESISEAIISALKIINQGMQQVTGYTYHVSGPWLNPVVEQVSIYKNKVDARSAPPSSMTKVGTNGRGSDRSNVF